jgi:hypothetical protein
MKKKYWQKGRLRALYFRQVLNSSRYMPNYLLVPKICLSAIFCPVRYLNTGRCKFRLGRDFFFYVTDLKQRLKLIYFKWCLSSREKIGFLKSFFNFLSDLRYCNTTLERGKLVYSCGSGAVVCQNSGRLFGANKKTVTVSIPLRHQRWLLEWFLQ